MLRCVASLFLAFAALAGIPVHAQLPTAPVIHVSLLAESQSIAPGQQFWVGVRFQMEKGWHIYWINPGDSGEPPRVQWRLPAGFQAGDFQWPHPERLVTKYSTDYGYADQMLLLAPIRPPAELAPGGKAELAGTVKWVVCREVCIPGKTEVALSLPVKRSASPQPNKLFDDARTRIPQPAPSRWRARARAEKNEFVLSIETGQPIAQAEFFPLQPQQIENAAPQPASALPRGVRLRLKKSEQLLKPIANLKGVIVLPSGKAYVMDAPVTGAGARDSKANKG
ncbi:MAG TPA: protein-disulfide reductase DsbD domain-containing protein [Terriglobales bacterium]|nr:protein-disulfide reductase DsbD domain-containing protein [Terriglobales bacterium]